ncbi:MAG: hypothetical protein NTX70_13620 [Verrucomicrobia bacterium]|nr:hypothetical protein [Verrucomicrobiota bacterium]
MKFIQIRSLILSLVCALWCTPGDTMAEPCLEIEGFAENIFRYNFKVSVGKSGFAFILQVVGEPSPRIIMGGENGIVGTLERLPTQNHFMGYASKANDVPRTGPGPGGLIYALYGNYSQSLKSDSQINLHQMMVEVAHFDEEPTVRQIWGFDSTFPFGATNMTAYVLHDAKYPKTFFGWSIPQFYPDGWKLGEMKVIQRDARTSIPTLVEATYFLLPLSVNQPQNPDQVVPNVLTHIEVTHIAEGQRDSYLPQIKTKRQSVIDNRGKLPDGEDSQYSLNPGDSWPPSDGPEFARRQSESLEEWKEQQKQTRHPLWPTATFLVGSGVILAFVIRFSRQRPEQITPQ